MFRNLTIAVKLGALVGVMSLFLVVIGGYGLRVTNALSERLNESVDSAALLIRANEVANNAAFHFKKQVQEWKDTLLRGNDAEDFDRYWTQFQKEEGLVHDELEALKPMMRQLGLNTIEIDDALKHHAELGATYREALKNYSRANRDSAFLVDRSVRGADRSATEQLAALSELMVKQTDTLIAAAKERARLQFQTSRQVSIVVIVLLAALAAVTYFLLRRMVQTPVEKLAAMAGRIAAGDFQIRMPISSGDEIGILADNFNSMTEKLEQTMGGLRKSQEELELRVQERTSELKASNEQLEREIVERKRAEFDLEQRSQELARSNSELEQFAYVASHDLQEPLRMVSSYVQLLEQRYKNKLDADADEFIDFAVDGARRMQGLINDLLAYSRVGSKGQKFQTTDCESVLARALGNLRAAIEESRAQIAHEHLPTVIGDATQLTQVFQNLIGNAIKFRGDHPPEVRIRAELTERMWCFSIQDNGIGIAPEYFDRVFVLFQRLHGRGTYSGTGIGLAICKKVVERHGGRIWVESTPGSGSTFHFTLPQTGA